MGKYVGFRLGKVHESHVISEYYCGGCGYPVTDHDSFCPECGGAFRESDASDLEAENARLRELVRDMWPSYCYANSGYETFLTDEQDAAIRERVRRLKVINK